MLSTIQTQKLTHFFKILDTDKNGILQKKDFLNVGENLCIALDIAPDTGQYYEVIRKCKKLYNIIFSHIPTQEADAITLEFWLDYFDYEDHDVEFEVVVDDFIELTVNNVFEVFDQNHDGSITIDEYTDMFKIYGIDITHSKKGFKLLDTDSNDRISREELEVALNEFFKSSDVNAKGNWAFGSWH